jgi:hypothetical protein
MLVLKWPDLAAEQRVPLLARPKQMTDEPDDVYAARVKRWEADDVRRVEVVAKLVDHDVSTGWNLSLRAVHIREDARLAAAGLTRSGPYAFATAEGVREYADVCASIVLDGLVRLEGIQVGAVDLASATPEQVVKYARRLSLLELVAHAVKAAQEWEGPEVLR